jgi:D-alanyl-D-alanine carboxypeptidase
MHSTFAAPTCTVHQFKYNTPMPDHQRSIRCTAVIVLLVFLTACANPFARPTPEPQPSATPTPTPSEPAPTATSTPTPTPSALPPTPTSTPPPTPTETPILEPSPLPPTSTPSPEPTSPPPTPSAPGTGDTLTPREIGANIRQVFGRLPPDSPGLVVLIDTGQGRYLDAFGAANIVEQTPLQVDDRFEIGSITKSFIAVLLLQLQTEGTLSLDDPLSAWLPEMAALFPHGKEITLRQLAQHRAGLPDYEHDLITGPFLAGDRAAIVKPYTPGEIVAWVAENKATLFAPDEGGQWSYSNTGYLLLGMVLEAATGQPVGDLLQERIFDPLELESAQYLKDIPTEGRIVHGYANIDGEYVDASQWNPSAGGAAGAIAMNARDLAIYAHALASGQLFDAPSDLDAMLAFVQAPAMDEAGLEGYGLGLIDYGNYWGHSGGTPGFGALMLIEPENELVIIALSNFSSLPLSPSMFEPFIHSTDQQ